MFKPKIKVIIEIYPGDYRQIWRELSESIIYETFKSIDLPSPNADAFTSVFLCTSPITIKRVMKRRKEIAELISNEITEVLLSEMGAKDTEMGYEIINASTGQAG